MKDKDFVDFFEDADKNLFGLSLSNIQEITNTGKVAARDQICLIEAGLGTGEKLFSTHSHTKPIYVLPQNVEEVREMYIKRGETSADEVEKQVNIVKNELEELPSKQWVDRQFPSADLEKLYQSILAYLQEKYPKLIIK